MKRQTKCEFFFPGSFFAESEAVNVESRVIGSFIIPKSCFAFQFYDLVTLSATREDGKVFENTEIENKSVKYFPNATLFNLEQIKALGEDFRILAGNMERNEWSHVIKTRIGNFQPFVEGETELITL